MKTDIPGVEWLLDCDPRPAQLEALARSYTGKCWRNNKDQPIPSFPFDLLPHVGGPASGWGHFMEMRVGKTPTLLNEFMLLRRDHGFKRLLVLSPNRYKSTWGKEVVKFGVDVEPLVFESHKRKQAEKWLDQNEEWVLIVNYEALTSQKTVDLLTDYVDRKTLMAADESVMIKNRNSGFFKKAHDISKEAGMTRPMTGLPTPQGVSDLYSQLRFARKLEGKNFYQFRNSYALMGGFMGKKEIGIKNEERLHALLHVSSFHGKRSEWATSLDSDYELVELEMTDRQKKAYNEMEQEFVAWLDSGDMVSADQVITKYIKLQQISSGFIYDENRQVHTLVPLEKTEKFQDLKDRIENRIIGKVIVIGHFLPTLDALYEALEPYGVATIRGNKKMHELGLDAEEEKKRFNEDPKCRVMLGQSKAIKYGHTLMGTPEHPCITTIYFENSYSLDDRAQSEQRNQGEGQTAPINIVDYASTPMEERVLDALIHKKDIAVAIMEYYKRGS